MALFFPSPALNVADPYFSSRPKFSFPCWRRHHVYWLLRRAVSTLDRKEIAAVVSGGSYLAMILAQGTGPLGDDEERETWSEKLSPEAIFYEIGSRSRALG